MKKRILSILASALLMTSLVVVPAGTASAEEPGDTYEVNMALGKAVSGPEGGYHFSNATDGVFKGNVCGGDYKNTPVVVNLGEATKIDYVDLYLRRNKANLGALLAEAAGLVISVSADNSGFTKIGEVGSDTDANHDKEAGEWDGTFNIYRYRFSNTVETPIQYIKISGEKTWMVVTEVEAIQIRKNAAVPADGNIAYDKPVNGTSVESYLSPDNLVDGDDKSGVGFNATSNILIDLQGMYPINAIDLVARNGKDNSETHNISVELVGEKTGDIENVQEVEVASALDIGDNVFEVEDKTQKYRYVRLKTDGYRFLYEVKVYIDLPTDNDQGNLAYMRPVIGAGTGEQGRESISNVNNAKDTHWVCWSGGAYYQNYGFAQVDLGNSYDLGKIILASRPRNTGLAHFKVLGSNDASFSDGGTELGRIEASPGAGIGLDIDLTEKPASYRYIRVQQTQMTYTLIGEIAVYAKGNKATGKISGVQFSETSKTEGAYEYFEGIMLEPGEKMASAKKIFARVARGDSPRNGFGVISHTFTEAELYGNQPFCVTFAWPLPYNEATDHIYAYAWSGFDTLQPICPAFEYTGKMKQ